MLAAANRFVPTDEFRCINIIEAKGLKIGRCYRRDSSLSTKKLEEPIREVIKNAARTKATKAERVGLID